MIHILLGPDDYSKKQHISLMLKQRGETLSDSGSHAERGGDLEVFANISEIPKASKLTEADLFSRPKTFVFDGIMPEVGNKLDEIVKSANHIIISINSLDKRKKENKELLENKSITVKEFVLPHGKELDAWILKRAGELKGAISPEAASTLAGLLGRDSFQEKKIAGKIVELTEAYNLWQVNSELSKLISYASGKNITPEMVKEIVHSDLEVNAMEITNALAVQDKQKVISLIQGFLSADTASDEKSSVIQLSSILAEQLRSIAIVQGFLSSNTPESIILEKTGWKSGRLFVMKKIAPRFSPKLVKETLVKLDALDTELKTGSTPPRVLLEMIVAQLV